MGFIYIAAALMAVILFVYWRVWSYPLIHVDDTYYLTGLSPIAEGLSWEGLHWAWTADNVAMWIPLTWLTFMVEISLFGFNPGQMHLTNLIFHLINGVLVFALLRRMTGAVWCSALAAGLFALHPMAVESVAWVIERKDVLSTCLALGALWFYLDHVKESGHPDRSSQTTMAPRQKSLLCYFLALLAKPMPITLPFLFLLLDGWPLKRDREGWGRLILEKWPYYLVAFLVIAINMGAAGAMDEVIASPSTLSLQTRLGHMLMAGGLYVWKSLVPVSLTLIHPIPPEPYPWWQTALSGGVLLTLTGWAWYLRQAHPWFAVGWLWFLGMLTPTLGLVQVGDQLMADRFTYLPHVGFGVVVAWGVHALGRRFSGRWWISALAGLLLLTTFATLAKAQLYHWRGSVPLLETSIAQTEKNYAAHRFLGNYHNMAGNLPQAAYHYRQAQRFNPRYWRYHADLGGILLRMGRWPEARQEFQTIRTKLPETRRGLLAAARYFIRIGLFSEARHPLEKVLVWHPDASDALSLLALVEAAQGEEAKAEAILQDLYQTYPQVRRRDCARDYPQANHPALAAILTRLCAEKNFTLPADS
ncbi:MAG: tetratricopeptide repeat protein [Magnetococcales bacterium]|nr:tetratricopeptide repeat protein [Magnetococcales bacterium]